MLKDRDQFDAIYNSVINGQFKQAITQAEALDGYKLAQLLDYIAIDLDQPDIALSFSKSWLRHTVK